MIYLQKDLANGIKAMVVLTISNHLAGGSRNLDHVGGILALAQAEAALYGLSWTGLVAECRRELGVDAAALLDVPKVIEG